VKKYKYPIIADIENRKITVGRGVYHDYGKVTLSGLIIKALGESGYPLPNEKIKSYYQRITKELGCTPSAYRRVFKACQYYVFIKPLEDAGLINFCFSNRKLNSFKINRCLDNLEEMKNTPKNLIPFILKFGSANNWDKTLKKLKPVFLENSLYRNKILARYSPSKIENILHLDSAILQRSTTYPTDFINMLRTWYPKGSKKLSRKYTGDLFRNFSSFTYRIYKLGLQAHYTRDDVNDKDKFLEIYHMYTTYKELTRS
jgi:hypothetical protein